MKINFKNIIKTVSITCLAIIIAINPSVAFADRTATLPFYLSDNGFAWLPNDTTYTIGGPANPFVAGYFTNLFASTTSFTRAGGNLDMGGYQITNAGLVTATRFTATSSVASIFPYASTTAITSSGASYFNSLAIGSYAAAGQTAAPSNGLIVSGNVGIGEAAPARKLSVQGTVQWGNITSSPGFNGYLTTGSTASALRPAVTRNLIGSTGDTYTIANGELDAYSGIQFGLLSGIGDISFFSAAGAFNTDDIVTPVARVHIVGTGDVGIGTTSPATRLDIRSSCTNTTPATLDTCGVSIVNTDSTVNNLQGIYFRQINSAGTTVTSGRLSVINTDHTSGSEDGDMIFLTMSGGTISEKMRILNSGNMGIATTSPSSKLTVNGNSYFAGAIYATSTIQMTGLTGATGGSNQDVCIAATTGNLVNETTGTCIVSSERFKNNIVPLDLSGIGSIMKLKPVEYSYNDDDVSDYKDRQYGFIAEDVADTDPHFAKYGIDGLPRTLDDRALLATSIKAIQELKKENDKLRVRIEKLENK